MVMRNAGALSKRACYFGVMPFKRNRETPFPESKLMIRQIKYA
jgi:hypothetical protein